MDGPQIERPSWEEEQKSAGRCAAGASAIQAWYQMPMGVPISPMSGATTTEIIKAIVQIVMVPTRLRPLKNQ